MINNINTFIEYFKNEWDNDPAGQLCLRLIKYMYEVPNDELKMLTLVRLGKIVQCNPLNENVIRAITILVSSKFHALDQKYIFIDEDGEFDLESEEIINTSTDHMFIHPVTGESIIDWDSRVVPYYTPSEFFLNLKDQK